MVRDIFFAKYDYNTHDYNPRSARSKLICNCCSKASAFKDNGSTSKLILATALMAIILAVFYALYKLVGYWCLIFLPVLLLAVTVYKFYTRRGYQLLPYDIDGSKPIIIKNNAACVVTQGKKISPSTTYGLKFETETDDKDFKRAFPDGMVPAVFHPNTDGNLNYDMRIIKPELVPKDVLFMGAKFLVEDYDGVFIAKGTIQHLDLDDDQT